MSSQGSFRCMMLHGNSLRGGTHGQSQENLSQRHAIKSRTRVPNCCRLRSRILGGVKNSFGIRRTGEHRLKVNKVRHKEIKMYTYCIKPLVISQECKLLPLIKNYHSGQYLFVHVMIYGFDYLLCKSSSLRVENSKALCLPTQQVHLFTILNVQKVYL